MNLTLSFRLCLICKFHSETWGQSTDTAQHKYRLTTNKRQHVFHDENYVIS